MTKPYTITLADKSAREKAAKVCLERAPDGYRVTFSEPKRSVDQNRRMWAMLRDVSEQVEYYGESLTPKDWKDIFTAAMDREIKIVPSLDRTGFVQLGLHTSTMSKEELSDLMEIIAAYGAMLDVEFKDQGCD